MQFENELIKGTVVGQHTSLITDVQLEDGTIVAAFSPEGGVAPLFHDKGVEAYLSAVKDKRRRIAYDIELVNSSNGLILLNPRYNLELFVEAFSRGRLPEFNAYSRIQTVGQGQSVNYADFELSNEKGEKYYIFIANLYQKEGASVVFPSRINFFEFSVFEEMRRLRAQNHKTGVFMIAPRQDCLDVRFSWSLDPVSAAKIFDEAENGLEFVCYSCKIDKTGVSIDRKLNIKY